MKHPACLVARCSKEELATILLNPVAIGTIYVAEAIRIRVGAFEKIAPTGWLSTGGITLRLIALSLQLLEQAKAAEQYLRVRVRAIALSYSNPIPYVKVIATLVALLMLVTGFVSR